MAISTRSTAWGTSGIPTRRVFVFHDLWRYLHVLKVWRHNEWWFYSDIDLTATIVAAAGITPCHPWWDATWAYCTGWEGYRWLPRRKHNTKHQSLILTHDDNPIQLRMEKASITLVLNLAGGQNSFVSNHFIQTSILLPRRMFGGIISTSTGQSLSMNNYLIRRMTLENWMFYSIAQIQCSKNWNTRGTASLSSRQSLTSMHQLSCNLNI